MEEILEIDEVLETNDTQKMNEVFNRLNNKFVMILVNHYLTYLENYYQYYLLMKKIGANHPREVPENKEVDFFVKKLKSIEEFFLHKDFSNHSSLEILQKVKILIDNSFGYMIYTIDDYQNHPDYDKYTFLNNILNKKLNLKTL
jgi:hypothetical protein